MSWRAALIDSCGRMPREAACVDALDAAAFVSHGGGVERRATVPDPTGHGSRIVQLWAAGGADFELLLGQVFLTRKPASAAAVAAAVDWAVAAGANLIHMSLGLPADRPVLAAAVRRADESGCLLVASAPARGGLVYPAGYAGVIRATGDARCAPGETSFLGPWLFGGCPRFTVNETPETAGASVGAAWVTRALLQGPRLAAAAAAAALEAGARYAGAERRGEVCREGEDS
jgi:hypothetical protein